MALSKADALEALKTVLENQKLNEAARLERIHAALDVSPNRTFRPTVQIPSDAPPLMRELARKSETNYLPLLVKTFSQVMKVDGYQTVTSDGADDTSDPWVWWQRNRMDSRQTGLTRSAISYGAAYATVLPGIYGRGQQGPAISLYSPRKMTALYQDPEADEWPMLAVAVDVAGDGSRIFSLFDEEFVYRFGDESKSLQAVDGSELSIPYGSGSLQYIDQSEHGLGIPPVIRYRDRNLLAGEEQYGIVEPLMLIQERINETTFEMLVAQYFQAFKQRYVLGWVPKDESEELKAGAARIWYLEEDPNEVKIDELDGGTITPYIDARNSAIRDFAAIGQVPAQALGIDGISNISDATLAGLEAAKNREGGEIMTSLGESHEQLMRLCALIDGNEAAADDYNSEIRWRNFEARSFSETVAGLVQLAGGLGIPTDALLSDIPGFTGQRIEQVEQLIRAQRSRTALDQLAAVGRGGSSNANAAISGATPSS